jgi:hypothetical protein
MNLPVRPSIMVRPPVRPRGGGAVQPALARASGVLQRPREPQQLAFDFRPAPASGR